MVLDSPNFTKFSVHVDCGQWPWLDPPLTTMQYYVYCWFCGDVMFGHNWPGKGDTNGELIESDSPGGRTGAKSDVYDCLLIVCVSEYAVC